MPKRSRTHQLEDISIQCFESLLPEEWVCRRKDKDYGVDLEVEVFDATGEATGLLFYVQLKATDDIEKERSVSMKVDRLEYLASFDSPAIVFRYCDASKASHWIWVSSIFPKMAKPKTETVTVQFEENDSWSNLSPVEIVETLKVYRTIRQSSRRTPIGLSIKPDGPANNSSFELNHAVSQIQDSSTMVIAGTDGSKCLPVTVWLEGDYLYAAIDVISSIGVLLRRVDREEILAQLAYVLAYMAGRYEFSSQAKDLTQVICDRGLVCQSREIASSLACQIIDSPSLCAEIASLNCLHDRQDEAYAMYVHSLVGSELPADMKSLAVKRFYSEAINSHEKQSPHSQSVIHYSFGNFLRIVGDLTPAIRQYNAARKKNAEYLEKDYFLAELAASLYFMKRFSLSARLYASSFQISKRHKTALCAGDAFLFSGDFKKASEFYEIASLSEDEFEKAEAAIKDWLAGWCAEFSDRNQLTDDTGLLSQVSFWSEVMDQSITEERYEHALGACLMLSFLLEDVEETWAQAMTISMKVKDPQYILATFSCAIWRCGYNAYAPFRDNLVANGFDIEGLLHFDQIVDHLNTLRTSTDDDEVTMRFVEQHHFDISVEVPDGNAANGKQ